MQYLLTQEERTIFVRRIAALERRIRLNTRVMEGCTDTPCAGCAGMNRENDDARAELAAILAALGE